MMQTLDPGDLLATFSTLSLYFELPDDVSVRDIEKTLAMPELSGIVKELMAAEVADLPSQMTSKIKANFGDCFTRSVSTNSIEELREIGLAIFDQLQSSCSELVVKLREADPALFEKLSLSSQFHTLISSSQSIEEHLKSVELRNSQAKTETYRLWEKTYLNVAVDAHGYLEPPDFDRKTKIPFDQLYVSPDFIDKREPDDPEVISLASLMATIDRTVILGDPGGGKSTVSRYIAFKAASKELGDFIPFYVILRNLKINDSPNDQDESLLDHIEAWLNIHYQTPAPAGCVEDILYSGRALVLLDGLDELINTGKRREITERVELFSRRYPLARILVTSRRVGYEQARLDPDIFATYGLADFSEDKVEHYVRKWFATNEQLAEDAAQSMAAALIAESDNVPDLRQNPLMLALICIIYRGENFIPKNRPAVYEKCATLLFEKWDSSRRIHVELRAADYVDAAMKHLAYWMLNSQNEPVGVIEADLVDECTQLLAKNFQNETEARHAAVEFIEFCRGRAWVFSDAGSTADGQPLYRFTHQTFMEYFAAFHLTRIADTPNTIGRILLPRISSQEWDVVAQLAIQIFDKSRADGAERVFNYFIKDRRRRSSARRDAILSFVVRCIAFIPVSQTFAKQLTIEIISNSTDGIRNTLPTRPGFNWPISSIVRLLRTREELIPAIQQQMEESLVDLFAGSDEEQRIGRFIVTELLSTPAIVLNQRDLPGPVHPSWRTWSAKQRREFSKYFGDNSLTTVNFWLLGEQQKLVTTMEAAKNLSDILGFDRLIDAFFVRGWSELSGMTYSALCEQTLHAAERLSIEPADLEDSIRTWHEQRLQAIGTAIESSGGPPFLKQDQAIYGRRFRLARKRTSLSTIKPEYLWIAVVILLIEWELSIQSSSERQIFMRRYPDPLQTLMDRRRGHDTDGLSTDEVVARLPIGTHHQNVLTEWAENKVSFVQPVPT
ncbi:NACHT domain-containing protein [Mycolicibacterium neoaurum]|nr:NACHT domain-containing protein [Mycolicibacterium neoaurum]